MLGGMQQVIDEPRAIANIAANVSRLLKEKGWSQGELARQAGERPMTISRIIHRAHMPTLPVVASIATALEVTVDFLLSDPPEKNSRRRA